MPRSWDYTDDFYYEPKGVSPEVKTLILALVIIAAVNIFAVFQIRNSIWIYSGEYARDWDTTAVLAQSGFLEFFKELFSAVHSGLGLSPLIPSLIMRVFGTSRLVFILSLINLYFLPVVFLVYRLSTKLARHNKMTAFSIMLIFPLIYYAALSGFSAVGGLIFCILCVMLHMQKSQYSPPGKKRLKEKTDKKLVLFTGLCLSAASLFDTVYLYFSIAFLITFLAEGAFLKHSIKNPAWTFLIWIIIALIPLSDWLADTQLTSSFSAGFGGVFSQFGLIVVVLLAVWSIYYGITSKDMRMLILWTQLIICYVMLAATSSNDSRCALAYIPSLIGISSLLFSSLEKDMRLPDGVANCIVCVLTAAVTIITLTPERTSGLMPSFSMGSRHIENSQKILAVARCLNTTVEDGQKVGVLADAKDFNADILYHAEASLGGELDPQNDFYYDLPFSDPANADLTPLYNMDFMVSADPAQYSSDDQSILKEAVISFEKYADFAMAYEQIEDVFNIKDEVSARIFKRARKPSEMEINDFRQRLLREGS